MLEGLINKIVVIGGNAAGLAAASQARRDNPEIDITVLESGDYISYGSCSLPYFISNEVKKIDDIFVYSKDFFEKKRNIKILTAHKVTGLDTISRKVHVDIPGDKKGFFDYDRLIVSSGATTIVPDIEGIDADNVFRFRDVHNALDLDCFIKGTSPEKAVILGGGSIGMLMAESLIKIGIKVTVVEMSENILGGFEDEISTVLYKKATLGKANILTGSKVIRIVKDAQNIAHQVEVDTPDGSVRLDIDMIILATGIKANTSFIKKDSRTLIDLGQKDAIKVTSRQQTSNLNIYAAGDCCMCKNLVTGKYDFMTGANNAAKSGRAAGENIVGGSLDFDGSVGTKIDNIFGLEIAKAGLKLKEATEHGFDAIKVTGSYSSRAHSLGGHKTINISLVFENRTGRILGAHMVGEEGVSKRIDILATAITEEMDIDQVYMLDLSYAPKVSTVWDPVNKICAKAVLNLKNRKI